MEWFLHWDNAPVHSMKLVQEYFKIRESRCWSIPLYSIDLALIVDFFLFPSLKKEVGEWSP
jgi:hypothetical protein